MPIMPYTTEKDPILQVVESYVNAGTRDRMFQLLWKLLDGDPIVDQPPIFSTTLDHPPAPPNPNDSVGKRQTHVRSDWFGLTQNSSGAWSAQQPPFDEKGLNGGKPTTGMWQYWYGDCEGIFRETLIRALSLSLGVPRESANDTAQYKGHDRPHSHKQGRWNSDQHWPINFLWKCPVPWWEGWIDFQCWGTGPREGHVTVVLSTPAHGVPLFRTPVQPPSSVGGDPYHAYAKNPPDRSGDFGLWVVTQTNNDTWTAPPASSPSGVGALGQNGVYAGPPVLGAPVHSTGDVVCVAPAVGDGGAAPAGIPYA